MLQTRRRALEMEGATDCFDVLRLVCNTAALRTLLEWQSPATKQGQTNYRPIQPDLEWAIEIGN